MTKSEAISQLQERIDLINKDYFDLQLDKYAEALEMAIEALRQFADPGKKVSQDLISRQEDLISREVALTHIDDVPYIKDHPNVGLLWKAWIENLPPAHPEKRTQERTETHACDLISRAMLLEYIHNEPVGKMLCDKYNLDGVIKQLPSAQPEIIYCKDCVKHNKAHGYYYDGTVIGIKDCCPLVEIRGKAQGHEFDYQYCAYAERRTDESDK